MDLITPSGYASGTETDGGQVMDKGRTRYGEGRVLAVPALVRPGRQVSIEFSTQLLREAEERIE